MGGDKRDMCGAMQTVANDHLSQQDGHWQWCQPML